MRVLILVITALTLAWGCSTTPGKVLTDTHGDATTGIDAVADVRPLDVMPDLAHETAAPLDLWFFDAGADAPFVECAPGEGCFLDPCTDNQQCQSAWCVEHMGDGVCTQQCSEECPPGWNCKSVGAGGPDLTYVCVSSHANLCRPCSSGADCKSVGGTEDQCLDYGDEGAFCGGTCTADDDCPWGFSCGKAVTVDGIETQQCLADAGVCPCTPKSVALSLSTACEIANEFGTCAGKRFCTEEGLTDCDAQTAQAEVCNGLDDDCDGSVDEPEEVQGKLLLPCDDDNPCTDDVCNGEAGCAFVPLTEGECLDGDACTIGDHCEEGVCVGAPIDCDDDNPCTDDVCDGLGGCEFLPNQSDCDDGDPCTVADTCKDTACVGFKLACDCTDSADCASLDDGNPCTGTLICSQGSLPYQCQVDVDTIVHCDPPEGPDAFCLASVCNPDTGKCQAVPDHEGLACNDGDVCTIGESCQEGSCTGGVPANCNDGNPCTDDGCDPVAGCSHIANDDPCQDGDACSVGDHCGDGQCQAGPAADCDDGNPCTDDGCQPNSGCTHVANDAACDDGNACTLDDKCQAGQCQGKLPLACNDDNVCTTDSCSPDQGCVHSLNTAPCDDGDLCTTKDQCQLGECVGSQPPNCNDNNVCTDDACSPEVGCTFTANKMPCDDGNACTANDLCGNGWCQGTALPCQDDNLCTDDSCDPDSGCIHTPNTVPCDDGDACTSGDVCAAGQCAGSGNVNCDDNNGCTDDSCDSKSGCIHANNSAPCDDANACTVTDVCADGTCTGAGAPNCDDSNKCTSDTCDSQEGCLHTPIAPCCGNAVKEAGEACDDGNEVDGDGCNTDCTAPPVADWRIGTWNGAPVYGFKNCASGDYYCQAKDACEQATGATCVWQEYNCSGYPNENGSFYPTSNPLGRSPSTNGGSDLNWTVTSGCSTTGACSHGSPSLYGNLCCCHCNSANQQWNEGNNYCGVGIWEPY